MKDCSCKTLQTYFSQRWQLTADKPPSKSSKYGLISNQESIMVYF
jgi:hypothetical protein